MVPNLMILGGTLLIAVGGILATKGWNDRSIVARRNGIIRSVAAELVINSSVLVDPKFTDANDLNLTKYTVFPRMQTAAMTGAIASGLFTGKEDRAFLTHVTSLSEVLDNFNRRLAITEDAMIRNPGEILMWRKDLRDGQTRKGLGLRLAGFAELLIKHYGITADDTFFVKLDYHSPSQSDGAAQAE